MARKGPPKQRAISRKGIRKEVESWSHERLVEFAMERIHENAEVSEHIERSLTARKGKKAASNRFRADIDRALDVGFVEWRQVRGFVGGLDSILEDIVAFGDDSPAEALESVKYFVESVPRVFECVHDECELQFFCRDLMKAALELAKKGGAPPPDVACKLLDVHLEDDTYRFGDFPEVLVEAKLPEKDRKRIADILDDLAAEVEAREAQALGALAKRLRRKPPARSGRPRKPKAR